MTLRELHDETPEEMRERVEAERATEAYRHRLEQAIAMGRNHIEVTMDMLKFRGLYAAPSVMELSAEAAARRLMAAARALA